MIWSSLVIVSCQCGNAAIVCELLMECMLYSRDQHCIITLACLFQQGQTAPSIEMLQVSLVRFLMGSVRIRVLGFVSLLVFPRVGRAGLPSAVTKRYMDMELGPKRWSGDT